MPPIVIDLRGAEDSRDVVHRAVQSLVEGHLVAFPTETAYLLAASALVEPAVNKLLAVTGASTVGDVALAVKSAEDALDYAPRLGSMGQRLARRCWPGPVTLVLPDAQPDSLVSQLPTTVRQALAPTGDVGLSVPAHQTLLDVLRLLSGPLVVTGAQRQGEPASLTAQEVVQSLGTNVYLVLDDGRSRYGQPASVVRVADNELEILRPGVVPLPTLRRLSAVVVLFVCTGNTCRSPMAEALCRQLLAEKMGCPISELEQRGVLVMSAGVAASAGSCASPEAVQVLQQQGLDLGSHESQPVTAQLIQHADHILAMTRGHQQAILSQFPQAEGRVRLVCRDQSDVPDPIGGPVEFYQRCAQRLRQEIAQWLETWEP